MHLTLSEDLSLVPSTHIRCRTTVTLAPGDPCLLLQIPTHSIHVYGHIQTTNI